MGTLEILNTILNTRSLVLECLEYNITKEDIEKAIKEVKQLKKDNEPTAIKFK